MIRHIGPNEISSIAFISLPEAAYSLPSQAALAAPGDHVAVTDDTELPRHTVTWHYTALHIKTRHVTSSEQVLLAPL